SCPCPYPDVHSFPTRRSSDLYVTGQFTIGYGNCTGPNPGGVILPPINLDGTSVYKRKAGSTIPVKFTLCDANGMPISLHDAVFRSEEHTSELQSRSDLVCRLL